MQTSKNQRRLLLDSQMAVREQLNGVNYSYCVRVASRDLHSIKRVVQTHTHTHSSITVFPFSKCSTVWYCLVSRWLFSLLNTHLVRGLFLWVTASSSICSCSTSERAQTGGGPKHRAVVALHSETQLSSPLAWIFFISTVQNSVHWFVQTLLELRNEPWFIGLS